MEQSLQLSLKLLVFVYIPLKIWFCHFRTHFATLCWFLVNWQMKIAETLLNRSIYNRFTHLKCSKKYPDIWQCNSAWIWSLAWQRNHTCMLGVLEMILLLEHLFNGYFFYYNFVRRRRTKFKASQFGYLFCFCINFYQINAESNQNSVQSSSSDSSFGLKSWIAFFSRAPSIPLLIIPFKSLKMGVCEEQKSLKSDSNLNFHICGISKVIISSKLKRQSF